MKKNLLILAAGTALLAGTMFTNSCSSPAKKEEKAEEKVQDAREDVRDAQKDLQQAQADAAKQQAEAEMKMKDDRKHYDAEWPEFRKENLEKIKDNEAQIADYRNRMKKSGKTMDKVYANRIDHLEEENRELEQRLVNYKPEQSNWEAFKTEFNHDMAELGQAFKDLTVDNKK